MRFETKAKRVRGLVFATIAASGGGCVDRLADGPLQPGTTLEQAVLAQGEQALDGDASKQTQGKASPITLEIPPSDPTMVVGERLQLSVTARDPANRTLPNPPESSATADHHVIAVDSEG